MKNNMKIQTTMFALFLALGILLQACSSSNQQEMVELEVRDTEIPKEEDATDSITTEEPTEIAAQDLAIVPENTSDNTDFLESGKVGAANLDISLTDDEIASLIYMREEEKLAKDVYLGLFELWGIPIFQNIANSEQTHTDAVKGLLDTFGIPDPADTSSVGVFTNQDLQNLYDELMATGSQSLEDALRVGAAIEEIDILDLKASLEFTQNQEIQRVYENLLRGSENHLRAFTSNLERQTGEKYQPQYLSQVDYDTIIESSSTRGGRGGGNQP
jgi:hypothetical protein